MLKTFGMLLGCVLLCSCAATPPSSVIIPATELPMNVAINQDAGHGGYLMITLRLEDGEALPFILDTGTSVTSFSKALEPKLGKRLGTAQVTGWKGRGGQANLYATPKLYLGNTRLMTGKRISTGSAILGMDCLKHYCLQLDFAAGKIRFLNPETNVAEWGEAFPLTYSWGIPFIHHPGLLGKSGTNLMIDTGCRADGLENQSVIPGIAQFLPVCRWDGRSYTNLTVAAVGRGNVLGLGFLARHLITLDFPKRMMYLKPAVANPPAGDHPLATANNENLAAAEFLERTKEKGQLPGLSKADRAAISIKDYSNFGSPPGTAAGVDYTRAYFNTSHKSITFDFWKDGDGSIYHYQISRASPDGPWNLQRAWLTTQDGKAMRVLTEKE